MFKKNEMVLYKKTVCKVEDIKENAYNTENYYILIPSDDQSLKIEVPVNNKLNNIKPLITKKELKELINKISTLEIIEEEKQIESEYKKLINSGTHEDLIKVIKTIYIRNNNRIKENKKISEKDNSYYKKATNYLYNEIKLVLNLSYEETKSFIEKEIKC